MDKEEKMEDDDYDYDHMILMMVSREGMEICLLSAVRCPHLQSINRDDAECPSRNSRLLGLSTPSHACQITQTPR